MSNLLSQEWDSKHKKYADADWIDKPTIFSQEIISLLPEKGFLLELGCGQGQDSRFFASRGYSVTATDFSHKGIEIAQEKTREPKVKYLQCDMSKPLPFPDSSFDIVYSHLAIHYFDSKTTTALISEILRVLKPHGVCALLVNSIHDPEYGTGEKIEDDFYLMDGVYKRFFSSKSLKTYLGKFENLILDEHGSTYKDRAKSVSNLVRFVGEKGV